MMSLEEQARELEHEAPRFRLIRAGDLEVRPLDWLVSGLFERDSLLLVFGDPSAGKSFWTLDLACCIAAGIEHHGRAVKPGPVVYLAGEGHNGLARRLKAWSIRHRIDLAELPLFISTMPAALIDMHNLNTVMGAIESTGERPALVVLDTLARNFGPGDENSTADMGHFIHACDELRIAWRCTVALVHHTGHGDKSRARGSTVLNGAVDTAYRLHRDDDDLIRVKAAKMKDGPLPDPFAFEFRTVELGIENEDGTEATSAVLHSVEIPDAQPVATGKHQKHALECLDRLTRIQRENLKMSGGDPDRARVTVDDWRNACTGDGMPRARWYDARNSLDGANLIAIEAGLYVSRKCTDDD